MKFLIPSLILLSSSLSFAQEKLETVEVLDHTAEQGLIDFVPAVITLKEKDLQKRRQATIGDTLQNEVGVTSTSFGPNASRPVIRGLDGSRIKLLQNSLQILDASTQSVDHAIPVDPLIVDEIEIVRGPMGLMYGTGVVGGVVNIVTNRIHSEFQEGHVAEIQTQGETVNDGGSHSLRFDYGFDKWMLHLDGATKNLEDQSIPHYARSKFARQTAPLAADETEAKNKIPNSANQQDSIGVGATRFFDQGSFGLAFNHFKNDYGTVAEEDVTIGMQQNRFELSGEHKLNWRSFQKVRIKSAQTDYKHREFEGAETGTIFKNKGNETRLELLNETSQLKGVTGIQTQWSEFEAQGEEAFLPEVQNQIAALFTFQEFKSGAQTYSASARLESTTVEKKSSDTFGASDELSFLGYNGSLGFAHKFTDAQDGFVNYSFTERAPTFQELFANGEHVATNTFELGSSKLEKEKSHGLEIGTRYLSNCSSLNVSVYSQLFANYIALNATGNTPDDIPEFQYQQVDAAIYGVDVDGKTQIMKIEKGVLNAFSRFDFVRGKDIENGDNLPRLSPPRLAAGLEYALGQWQVDGEVQHVFDQMHTAPLERRTEAYTLTNLGGQYTLLGKQSKLDVFLRVRNLFDVEARSHVSFLKEIAPLPGRNVILGLHWLI
jgi:iron complex outermembrane receptor protein